MSRAIRTANPTSHSRLSNSSMLTVTDAPSNTSQTHQLRVPPFPLQRYQRRNPTFGFKEKSSAGNSSLSYKKPCLPHRMTNTYNNAFNGHKATSQESTGSYYSVLWIRSMLTTNDAWSCSSTTNCRSEPPRPTHTTDPRCALHAKESQRQLTTF